MLATAQHAGHFARRPVQTCRHAVTTLGVLIALLLPVLVLPARPVAAAPAVRLSASVHFGGNYRVAEWVPVTVSLANDGPNVTGDVTVQAVSTSGSGSTPYFQRVELPTRSQKALTLYTLAPSYTTELRVSFRSGKEVVETLTSVRALKANQRLIVVISDEARTGSAVASSLLAAYGNRVETVAVGPEELPANSYGLGSVGAIVLNDATTGRLGDDQRRALAAWVARGGHLVVTGGASWRKTFEGLGDLPPLLPGDSRTVTGLGGLARFAGGAGGPAGDFVVATGDLTAGASRLVEHDGVALVAARGWGHGTVTSLAFDPATPSFLSWRDAGPFWDRLALNAAPVDSLQHAFTSGGGAASSVESIVRNLPSLALPPTWLLLLVMLLFTMLVGPVNYLVLRKLDRRELGWVTVPALTLLFAAGIYGVGAGLRGGSVIANTVSVVRIAPAARLADVQSVYGIFSPSRGVRDLTVGRDALLASFDSSGLGKGNLGGDARVEQGANAGVRAASFSQWSLSACAAQALLADPTALALRLELRHDGSKIVGQITNPSNQPVEDVVLSLGGVWRRVGNLPSGGTVAVDWSPAASVAAGQVVSWGGLGRELYPGAGIKAGGNNDPKIDNRAELLDALSGNLLTLHNQTASGTAFPSSTPTPTGTTAPRQTTQPPLQVIFWRDDTPLPLQLAAGQENRLTLVVQEAYLGGPTQDRPVTLAGGGR